MGPPMPDASISRNAAGSGEPNSVLMAAKLPAAPITRLAWAGASRLASCTASTPRPPPIAISGASGPSTTPRLSVANAASAMPGRSIGCTMPPVFSPSAGEWPPVPGRYRSVAPTASPLSASSGSGHHRGRVSKPRSPGSVVKAKCWVSDTSFRKKYAASATTTPTSDPNTSTSR